jgi:hypothetical protein
VGCRSVQLGSLFLRRSGDKPFLAVREHGTRSGAVTHGLGEGGGELITHVDGSARPPTHACVRWLWQPGWLDLSGRR